MSIITYEEYERRYDAFMEAQTEQPTGFSHSLILHADREREFHRQLREDGITVAPRPKWKPNWKGRLPG